MSGVVPKRVASSIIPVNTMNNTQTDAAETILDIIPNNVSDSETMLITHVVVHGKAILSINAYSKYFRRIEFWISGQNNGGIAVNMEHNMLPAKLLTYKFDTLIVIARDRQIKTKINIKHPISLSHLTAAMMMGRRVCVRIAGKASFVG